MPTQLFHNSHFPYTRAGWTTRDPTPEAFLPQNRDHRAGYGASLLDAMSVGYDRVTDWLGNLNEREERVTTLPADQGAVERHILSLSRAAREGAAA